MKPKTLGEMLDADKDKTGWLDVLHWLERHNIYDATPLVVEAVGVLEDTADHGHAPVMAFRVGEKHWQHMEDCEGRTVALLAEEGK